MRSGALEERLTVVVADDHPIVLESLCRVLEPSGFDVCARARNGPAALEAIERWRPDAALLDVVMPGLGGIEVARQARRRSPGTAVVLFTSSGERALVAEAFAAGARGYILKQAPSQQLVLALRTVIGGGTYVDGSVGTIPSGEAGELQLTAREREVLSLLAQGLHGADIAERLELAPETVRADVGRAMRKLDARTRTQAVAQALRRSLI